MKKEQSTTYLAGETFQIRVNQVQKNAQITNFSISAQKRSGHARNRTWIQGFGDPYTIHCTT
jgi:hypothetical protein